MNTHVSIFVWGILLLGYSFRWAESVTNLCSQPGFTISDDQNWCFAMPVNFEYWTQTSVLCRAYGARLVVIDSAAKHSLVQSYLASKTGGTSTQQVWIGKTNTFGEGLGDGGWIDVTVGPTPYIDWATGFPLSTDKTNCMYITNGSPDYKMKNDQCLKSFKAVCEYAYDGTGTL